MRAVTDTDTEVRYDIAEKPGVVESALDPRRVHRTHARRKPPPAYTQYGPLKKDTAAAVVETVRPIQTRYAELSADPAETTRLLATRARSKAAAVASVTLRPATTSACSPAADRSPRRRRRSPRKPAPFSRCRRRRARRRMCAATVHSSASDDALAPTPR